MSETNEIKAEFGGIAKIIVAAAIAIALIVGTPIGLITLGNASHDHACTTLPDRQDRLACLTNGTLQEQAVRDCSSTNVNAGLSGTVFDQCMALALDHPYGASSAFAHSSASTSASGG